MDTCPRASCTRTRAWRCRRHRLGRISGTASRLHVGVYAEVAVGRMSHLQIEIDESLRFPAATLKKIIRRKLDKLLSDELVPREDGASEARRVQLDKDAQLAFSAAATVFVSYITAISTAVGAERKRTTLNMDDVIEALRRTEFEDFAVEVEQFVQNWRMLNERRKAQARQARVERKRKEPENSDVENDDGAYASDMPQEDTEDPEEDDLIEGT